MIGYARHGKDTVCNLLRDIYGLGFVSSSFFVAEKAVRPWLEQRGRYYDNLDSCYADRVNHRGDWFDAIAAYNANDPARLGRELFAEYDIYCGLRRLEEFLALKKENVFHTCWWIDRGLIEPPEPITSNTLRPNHADFIVNNNGSLDLLRGEVIETHRMAFKKLHIK